LDQKRNGLLGELKCLVKKKKKKGFLYRRSTSAITVKNVNVMMQGLILIGNGMIISGSGSAKGVGIFNDDIYKKSGAFIMVGKG